MNSVLVLIVRMQYAPTIKGNNMRRIFYLNLILLLLFISISQGEERKIPSDWKPYNAKDYLIQAPQIEIKADGKAIFNFITTSPTPGAKIYLGLKAPNTKLDYPVYQKFFSERSDTLITNHKIICDLSYLVKLKGVNDYEVYYRIEAFYNSWKQSLYYDGRFRYTKKDTLYTRNLAIIEGPFVDCITTNSAIISWRLDDIASGQIVIRSDKGSIVFTSTKKSDYHEIYIEPLEANTYYEYYVESISTDNSALSVRSDKYHFHTAPLDDEPFRFAIMTDSRASAGGGEYSMDGVNVSVLSRLMQDAYRQGAAFVLFPGDLISGYVTSTEQFISQLRVWKSAVSPIGHYIPIYEGIGNHDVCVDIYRDDNKKKYYIDKSANESTEYIFAEQFVNPTNAPERENLLAPTYLENVYSFDYGNSHFITLNTNYWFGGAKDVVDTEAVDKGLEILGGNREGYIMDKQLEWLEMDLISARNRENIKYIFVCAHEPAFASGFHLNDTMWWNGKYPEVIERRDDFWRLLGKYKVTAAIFGDEHFYTRGSIGTAYNPTYPANVYQIVTGGAGAPLYTTFDKAPWKEYIDVFAMQHHYVLIEVMGDNVLMRAISISGEILDELVLNGDIMRMTSQSKTSTPSITAQLPKERLIANNTLPPIVYGSPNNKSKGNFAIQVGSYLEPYNAEKQKNHLINKGYNVRIIITKVRDKTYHRVCIGNYISRSEAENVLIHLRKQEDIADAYVISL